MSLSNPNKPVTEQRLQEFYHKIEPYMGGGGGTGGGGHTIEDSEGTDLTQRDTMQFGDGFNASDDSENEKTVVEPNLMTAADMDDVVTPLPSVRSRYHKYSTEEQIVGEWIDGKPIYEKTFIGIQIPKKSSTAIVQNVDTFVDCKISYIRTGTREATPSFYNNSNDFFFALTCVNVTTHDFYVYWNSPYTVSDFNITVQYTKTTS